MTTNNTEQDRAVAETLTKLLEDGQLPLRAREAINEFVTELMNETEVHSNATDLLHINLPLAFERLRKQGNAPPTTAQSDEAGKGEEEEEAARLYPDFQAITPERAQELVSRILKYDDDEDAMALIALIGGIAYDRDHLHRDGVALHAIQKAFSFTTKHSVACDEFAAKASSGS